MFRRDVEVGRGDSEMSAEVVDIKKIEYIIDGFQLIL